MKLFTYNYPSSGMLTGSLTIPGCYAASSLEKVSSEDEDGRRTDTYSTPRGLTVCTRTWLDSSDYLETHYVYDLKDSLVCVIQPEGMAQLGTVSNVAFSSDIARKYCFLYRYDGLGRIIESQVPGGGVSEYAYDERSRLVAHASAEMVAHRLYRITQYDTLDRVTSEYYANFSQNTDAESLRLAMKTWDGSEASLPAHTTVRRTYAASYYPFQVQGGGTGGDSGHILPDPGNPPLEDFEPIDDGTLIAEEIVTELSPLDFVADALATSGDLDTEHHRGMLMEETVSSVPGINGTVQNSDTTSVTRRYYYDYRGNVIQMRELASDGWSATYSTRYDFAGNVTGTFESHTSPTGMTHSVRTDLTLDQRGNVLSEKIYADGSLVTETGYSYDELMRPTGRATEGLSETVALDIRGWRTESTVTRWNDTVFSQSLSYMNPSQGVTPQWAGLVSEATTTHFGNLPNTFAYEYDAAGRLVSATSQRGSEGGIEYDANGNMLSLQRREGGQALSADLELTYAGNRLVSVDNSGNQHPGTFTFDYDESGNMVRDSRKRLEISPNVLNLPMIARDTVGSMTSTMTYTFLGDGTRVGARVSSPDAAGYSGMRYRGSFVYDVTVDGVHSLQSIAVSTGRLIALTGTNGSVSFESDGFITDHLGNVAAVVNLSAPASTSNANVILEQDEYYPFGTKMEAAGMKTQATNRYRYAGKEEQNIAGMDLGLLDFGARYYDAFTCRWNAIDPLAHKYFGMSPYNYCGNDPVNFFDPDGMTDYFDNDGNFLYNDGKDNGEMRTLDALHFWGLVIESIQNGYSSNESNGKLYAVSTAVKDTDLTDDALFEIASHYNETGYKVRLKDLKKDETNGDMATIIYPDGTVNICIDARKCFNKGYFESSFNIINALNGHEGNGHAEKYKELGRTAYFNVPKPQRELNAIESQRNHPSWEKTTKRFKAGTKKYEDYYKSLL